MRGVQQNLLSDARHPPVAQQRTHPGSAATSCLHSVSEHATWRVCPCFEDMRSRSFFRRHIFLMLPALSSSSSTGRRRCRRRWRPRRSSSIVYGRSIFHPPSCRRRRRRRRRHEVQSLRSKLKRSVIVLGDTAKGMRQSAYETFGGKQSDVIYLGNVDELNFVEVRARHLCG